LEYLIDPYLPRGQLHVLGGSSGAGKTTFMFQLISRLRTSDNFGPFQATERIVPVYVANDRVGASTVELISRLSVNPSDFIIFNCIDEETDQFIKTGYKLSSNPAKATGTHWLNRIGSFILDYNKQHSEHINLVVLDTGLAFIPASNINDQKQAQYGMTQMAAWASGLDVAVIMTWHTNKVREGEDFLNIFNRISGSHSILGFSSTKMLLVAEHEQKDNHYATLHLLGQHFPPQQLKFKREDGMFIPATKEEVLKKQFILYGLLSLSDPKPTKQIVKEASETMKLSRSSVYRQLKQMEMMGIAEQPNYGEWILRI